MYLKKVEYLESIHPSKDCISVIVTSGISDADGKSMIIPIGAPCTMRISPFSSANFSGFYGLYTNSPSRRKKQPASKDKKDPGHCAKDLYAMDVVEANKLIHNYVRKSKALFMFPTDPKHGDFSLSNVSGRSVYFSGIKPILSDNFSRYDLHRLSDVHSKEDINGFAEMTADALLRNRYINYTFVDVAESNKKYMLEDINTIFNNLRKVYKHNVSFFQSIFANNRSLLDIVSISFYRLADATAIFDSRNASGMVVEVLMTNSLCTPSDMGIAGKSSTYRFFFSSSSENVFTIDGLRVHRPGDCPTDNALLYMYKALSTNVPNNEALKPKRSTKKT